MRLAKSVLYSSLQLLSSTVSKNVILVNISTGKILKYFAFSDTIAGITALNDAPIAIISLNDGISYVLHLFSYHLSELSFISKKKGMSIHNPKNTTKIDISNDGRWLALVSGGKKILCQPDGKHTILNSDSEGFLLPELYIYEMDLESNTASLVYTKFLTPSFSPKRRVPSPSANIGDLSVDDIEDIYTKKRGSTSDHAEESRHPRGRHGSKPPTSTLRYSHKSDHRSVSESIGDDDTPLIPVFISPPCICFSPFGSRLCFSDGSGSVGVCCFYDNPSGPEKHTVVDESVSTMRERYLQQEWGEERWICEFERTIGGDAELEEEEEKELCHKTKIRESDMSFVNALVQRFAFSPLPSGLDWREDARFFALPSFSFSQTQRIEEVERKVVFKQTGGVGIVCEEEKRDQKWREAEYFRTDKDIQYSTEFEGDEEQRRQQKQQQEEEEFGINQTKNVNVFKIACMERNVEEYENISVTNPHGYSTTSLKHTPILVNCAWGPSLSVAAVLVAEISCPRDSVDYSRDLSVATYVQLFQRLNARWEMKQQIKIPSQNLITHISFISSSNLCISGVNDHFILQTSILPSCITCSSPHVSSSLSSLSSPSLPHHLSMFTTLSLLPAVCICGNVVRLTLCGSELPPPPMCSLSICSNDAITSVCMVETASKYRIDRSSGGGRTELEESKVHQRNVDGNNRDRMVKVGV
ncbi:hypothetical protein ADUPG1_012491, partial [Aduncisulcus paluster]